jgi:LPS export ABC transporter protein LptC
MSLSLLVLLGLGACTKPNSTAKRIEQTRQQVDKFDNSLTFDSVTLEEFDQQGRLWWRVKATQARYKKDNKIAAIQQPSGELFQDGKPILRVSAKTGEIRQDGKAIILREDITATDLRDGTQLKGKELEWQPEKDLLVVRNTFTGKHKQLTMAAKEALFLTRARQIDLIGQVVATATQQNMQIKSEKLTWLIQPQKVQSNEPVQLARTQNKIVDQARANKGMVDLKTKIATLQQNAQVTLGKSQLQIMSNTLVWNVTNQTIASNTDGVTIINPAQQLTLTAMQGQLNMQTNMAYLIKNVKGVSGKRQARLNADRLDWNLTTEQFEATGNVFYNQSNPPVNLVGPKAIGGLAGQNVVVSGGRVETSFIP